MTKLLLTLFTIFLLAGCVNNKPKLSDDKSNNKYSKIDEMVKNTPIPVCKVKDIEP